MSTNGNLKSAAMPAAEIYTDGGCEPNPGAGGYGVVLVHPKKRVEVSGGFRLTTNKRMEIFAAIAGLEFSRAAPFRNRHRWLRRLPCTYRESICPRPGGPAILR